MPMEPLSEAPWNSSTYCHPCNPSTLLIFDVSWMQKAQFRWEFYWVSCKGPKQLRTNYYLSAPAKMDTANLLPLNLPGLQHCDVFLLYRFLIDTQIASKLAVALSQSRALGAGYFSQKLCLVPSLPALQSLHQAHFRFLLVAVFWYALIQEAPLRWEFY